MSQPEIIPPFVKSSGGIWCLKFDSSITPEVERRRRLNWDDSFMPVRSALQGQPVGLVLDVGAYIGDSAAWFCDWPLVNFEPQVDAFTCLAHNLPNALNLPLPVGNNDLVKLRFEEGGNLGARWVETGGTVRATAIDDWKLGRVALLKIDVEGYEPEVLDGAEETIVRSQPIVLVEINPRALEAHGFNESDVLERFEGWKKTELGRSCDGYDLMLQKP
jgi:FkbM family methyltransferase